jgi:hypothetical protein
MLSNYIVPHLRIMMNLQLHIDDNVDYNKYTKKRLSFFFYLFRKFELTTIQFSARTTCTGDFTRLCVCESFNEPVTVSNK